MQLSHRYERNLPTSKPRSRIAFIPPPIDGLGNAGGFQMQVQDRGGVGLVELGALTDELVARRKCPIRVDGAGDYVSRQCATTVC